MKTIGIAGAALLVGVAAGGELRKAADPKPALASVMCHQRGCQATFTVMQDGKPVAEKAVMFAAPKDGTVGYIANKDLPPAAAEFAKAFKSGQFDSLLTAPVVARPPLPGDK